MGLSPRVVTEDRQIAWDGVTQRLPKGQVMDVPPGSALERAIGAEFLVPLGPTSALPPAEEAPAEKPAVAEKPQEPAPAAPKVAAAPVKKQDAAAEPPAADVKDGDS